MRTAYVNGQYIPHRDAFVHIEDRGYQFSDGIYEVAAFFNRTLLDGGRHLARLQRSLKELHIAEPMSMRALQLIIAELIDRNRRIDGTIYIQVSRGVAKRDHPFPQAAKPALVMTITGPKMPKAKEVSDGVAVITRPDIRWGRRDIKTVSLLPNVLAKQDATQAGAREAWLLDDKGNITEGAVSNNFIVTKNNELITHPKTYSILPGITRDVVIELARKAGMKLTERQFSLKEALAAKEAFLTSTTSNVLPVTSIDGKSVGNGHPGETTLRLLDLYYQHIYAQTGKRWN